MPEEINKTPTQQEDKQENIFIANPEPPKKAKTNTVLVAALATITFVIIVVAATMLWSFSAGNEAAKKYNQSAKEQVSGLQTALDILKPDQVVNNKSIEPILQKLGELNRPKLNNVFFASTLSRQYRAAEQTSEQLQEYYKDIRRYGDDAMLSVEFSDEISQVKSAARYAASNLRIEDSASLRTIAGTYSRLEQQILDSNAPAQYQDLQAQIAELYDEQADNYQNWAEAVEQNKPDEVIELQKDIAENNKDIRTLTSDPVYIEQFEDSYKNLEKQQKALEKRLSS
ncbi:hypothetical protein KC939_01460 [Candidatus Saccharibacteria bacterium]|nr:hypothetical protein [Candidatus Saccharibacteria bacterium]